LNQHINRATHLLALERVYAGTTASHTAEEEQDDSYKHSNAKYYQNNETYG
jgi:hypothetical protein